MQQATESERANNNGTTACAGPEAARLPVQVHLIVPGLVGWALQQLVQAAGAPFRLAGVSSSMAEALQHGRALRPDVVVAYLDGGCMADELLVLPQAWRSRLLVVTAASDGTHLAPLVASGACAAVSLRDPPSTLLDAMAAIAAGRQPCARPLGDVRQSLVISMPRYTTAVDAQAAAGIASLTARERQAIAAIARGTSAPLKLIADRLCISEHTLRNHLSSIYSKLGVCGRLGLYAFATRHGLDAEPAPGRAARATRRPGSAVP